MNEIVDNMHRNRFLSVIAFFLIMMLTLPVMANWAGPDQKILRKVDNSQTVTLSVLTPGGYCYRWSGPNILTDRNQPTIQANPTEEQSIYICLRIGANGVEEDQVVVSVVDEVRIVSVKPKRTCYSPGDPIDLEDFEILTEPKGYEDIVSYSPVQISGGNGFYPTQHWPDNNGKWDEVIVFSIDYLENHSEKPVIVNVLDPEAQSHTIGAELNFLEWGETILKYDEIVENVENTIELMKNAKGLKELLKAGFVEPNLEIIIGELSFEDGGYRCCNNHVERFGNFHFGGLTISGGLGFEIPFPIPMIPGAMFTATVEAGVKITIGGLDLQLSSDPNCIVADVPFTLEGQVTGLVGVAVFSPKLAECSGGVEGSLSVGGTWHLMSGGLERNPTVLKATIVTRAKLIGLNIFPFRWTFVEFRI